LDIAGTLRAFERIRDSTASVQDPTLTRRILESIEAFPWPRLYPGYTLRLDTLRDDLRRRLARLETRKAAASAD